MVTCSVPGCDVTSRYNPNQYTFHRFPRCLNLREKWLRTINRPDWNASPNSTICSKHFEKKCLIQRKSRRVLMKDSIPTLFVPIQLPRRRPVSSYVNRDITLPPEVVTPSSLAEPTPGPSNLVLTPRRKKLIGENTRLKRKIAQKNRALRNLKAKVKRMTKFLLTLQEVVKELNNSSGLTNHHNDVEVACRNNLMQKLVDRVNGRATEKISRTAEYNRELNIIGDLLPSEYYSFRSE